MFWFKGCPRCAGDLHTGNDVHGPYVACIQCGHHLTDREIQPLMNVRQPQAPAPEEMITALIRAIR